VSGTPPPETPENDRAKWDRNLEHVRAIRAALAANRLADLRAAGPADLAATEAAERRRYILEAREAAAAARAAQEAATAGPEETTPVAEVLELRPTAEEAGK